MLDKMDPKAFSKWDKEEGEKEREKVIHQLRQRISSRHPMSLYTSKDESVSEPNYGVDDRLTDQRQRDKENEMDEALVETIKLIQEFSDCFARMPKNPGTTTTIEHTIDTEGQLPAYHLLRKYLSFSQLLSFETLHLQQLILHQ